MLVFKGNGHCGIYIYIYAYNCRYGLTMSPGCRLLVSTASPISVLTLSAAHVFGLEALWGICLRHLGPPWFWSNVSARQEVPCRYGGAGVLVGEGEIDRGLERFDLWRLACTPKKHKMAWRKLLFWVRRGGGGLGLFGFHFQCVEAPKMVLLYSQKGFGGYHTAPF